MVFVVKLWLYNYTFTIGVYKFEVTNLNQPERFQRKWLSQLNRFFCSSCLYDTVSLEISKKKYDIYKENIYISISNNCFPRQRHPT